MPTLPGFTGRLKKIINDYFDGVASRLYESAEISGGTFQTYLDGVSIPGGEALFKLKRAVKEKGARVSLDWLLTGEEQSQGREEVLNEEDRQFLNIVHNLNEEDKKSWMRMGLLLLKNPTGERTPSASESAEKKTRKGTKKT